MSKQRLSEQQVPNRSVIPLPFTYIYLLNIEHMQIQQKSSLYMHHKLRYCFLSTIRDA